VLIPLGSGPKQRLYDGTIKRWRNPMNTPPTIWMIQVIYADGRFEDRYVAAASAEQAIEIVRGDTPPATRRWARFIA
jgi:hypothetical protein